MNVTNVSLILIGSELLNGKVQDLNGHWLGRELSKYHANLNFIHTTSDEPEKIKVLLKESFLASDLIILSGGLGPTPDDITKNVLAEYFNLPLEKNEQAQRQADKAYESIDKNRDSKSNHYHLIPRSFEVIFNGAGLAPGLKYCCPQTKKTLMAVPGVPREFNFMLTHYLKENFIPKKINNLVIKTFAVAEEKMFNELMPNLWKELEEFGQVSSLPQSYGTDIYINAHNDIDLNAYQSYITTLFDSPLAPHIWATQDISPIEKLISLLNEKKFSIGFAESCTGGLVSSMMTDVPGSSKVFKGSVVSYANEVKMESLGVDAKTIKENGAVSAQTAKEMAIGLKNKLDVDIALSFSGIAGPSGGSEKKPVGTLSIGISSKDQSFSEMVFLRGDRVSLKHKFALFGIFKLIKFLE